MSNFDSINRSNADYIDSLYEQYQKDPRSLAPEWQAYFTGFDSGYALFQSRKGAPAAKPGSPAPTPPAPAVAADPVVRAVSAAVADLVHAFREFGHHTAVLDPLGLANRSTHPVLDLAHFGLSVADLDKRVGPAGFAGPTDGTLRDLIEKLRTTYCGSIGVEYEYIADKNQRDWIAQRIEPTLNRSAFNSEQAKGILRELINAHGFEEFLATRYVGVKRFGLEGGDSLIPLLNTLIEDAANLGAEDINMGMAHRGRLNVLAHVLRKPYETILTEFEGVYAARGGDNAGSGDVKYHMGYSQDYTTAAGRKIHVALAYNPSHLELVNPVVEGSVRSKQHAYNDTERTKVVPILIHGDAAFAGQGIVPETLALSELKHFRTGGTIHVIINNQVGFTTPPSQARFTPYPSDVAKMVSAPIFHVNGDDPEAVVHCAKIASAFRQQFKCDVVIDLWCYRKNGHNETDEPDFTQPVMYRAIKAQKPVRDRYAEQLLNHGKLTTDEYEAMKKEHWTRMDAAQVVAKETRPKPSTNFSGLWKNISRPGSPADWYATTGVAIDVLKKVGAAGSSVPAGFNPHPKIKRVLDNRALMSQGKAAIDWGTAEMFAFGSLLLEGHHVRLTGQDVERGTFSHRHAVLNDVQTGIQYTPLANIDTKQSALTIVNTMLSELAVLGFEYGYSTADPRNLVLWEAQFGDFVNGAQAIIDQFIVAAESKWNKMSGLVMLLPHGYEGQGPEHSYAYLDRFLALCAENNIQVVVPSLPSQYFHALRRQVKRKFRKPLVLMMPKSLLRAEFSTCSLDDLAGDTQFQNVIDDPMSPPAEGIKRVLYCSGKVYFSLNAARVKHKLTDTAIVRVEQLHPFPAKELEAIKAKYPAAAESRWVQEEPRNRGPWMYCRDMFERRLGLKLNFFGREESASPATGNAKVHAIEEVEILSHALELPLPPGPADKLEVKK